MSLDQTRRAIVGRLSLHEETKVHLLTYARNQGEPPVKPFMLVIARDTSHASQLMKLITTDLFDGRYAGKVIQVDSGTTSGAEGDEIVKRLLGVESYDEPTEIVIHVNMLKEGWDVTNLYTIVPLRAANARTLIEQSIGRGLRLPCGRKTGVEPVDRLNIIAHDRFQEVINEAGRGDSPIRLKQLILEASGPSGEGLRNFSVTPMLNAMLGIAAASQGVTAGNSAGSAAGTTIVAQFNSEQAKVAKVVLDVINELSLLKPGSDDAAPVIPTSAALKEPAIQTQISAQVTARITPAQAELLLGDGPSIAEIVARTTALIVEYAIDIPRILVKPKGSQRGVYRSFALDVSKLNVQPQDSQLVSRGLQTGKDVLYGEASAIPEHRPADYIVRNLIDFDDVSYDEHADLIYALAEQAVAHLKSYLKSEAELHNVLANQGKIIAEHIHAQMAAHWDDDVGEFEIVIKQGFTPLRDSAVTAVGEVYTLQRSPPDLGKIGTLVFGGFAKCAYTHQKFHSDTERVLAVILERDSRRWFRPVRGQLNIYYRSGVDESEYVPDFVAATADASWLIETKRVADMASEEVQAKAKAANTWCTNASNYAVRNGGRPWRYLLIPHDVVAVNATLAGLSARYCW